MSEQWFYADGDRQQGPVDAGALRQLVSSGRIDAQTLVWREGLETWIPASQAPGVGDDFAGGCLPLPPGAGPQVMLGPNGMPLPVGAWCLGKTLICSQGYHLPPLCAVTGKPVDHLTHRTYYWSSWGRFIFRSRLFHMMTGRRGDVMIGLSAWGKWRKAVGGIIMLAGTLLGLAAMVTASVGGYPALAFPALAFTIGVLIAGAILTRPLQPKRITPYYVWLIGCSMKYLRHFPPLPVEYQPLVHT